MAKLYVNCYTSNTKLFDNKRVAWGGENSKDPAMRDLHETIGILTQMKVLVPAKDGESRKDPSLQIVVTPEMLESPSSIPKAKKDQHHVVALYAFPVVTDTEAAREGESEMDKLKREHRAKVQAAQAAAANGGGDLFAL